MIGRSRLRIVRCLLNIKIDLKDFQRGVKRFEKVRKSYNNKLGGVFARNAKLAVGLARMYRPKLPNGLLQKFGKPDFNAERAGININGAYRGTNAGGNIRGVGYLFQKNGVDNISYSIYNRRKVNKKKFNRNSKIRYADLFVQKKYGDQLRPIESRVRADFKKGVDVMLKELEKEL